MNQKNWGVSPEGQDGADQARIKKQDRDFWEEKVEKRQKKSSKSKGATIRCSWRIFGL